MSEIKVMVKPLRIRAGLSQAELAKKANVSGAAISQIEAVLRIPSLPVLRKISNALNVSISEVIGDARSLNDKASVFYKKFGIIKKLSSKNQEIILALAKALEFHK